MIEHLIEIDMRWFDWVHNGLANELFDTVLPWVRNKYNWVPFYVLFMLLALVKLKWKGLALVLVVILTVAIADQLSANLIKESVQRLRPCNEPLLAGKIRPLVHCGGGFSFISAHATNHFAIAVFFSWFFYSTYKRALFRWVFYLWAASIAFAQVYVGVHYPLDVIGGMVVGLLIGSSLLTAFKYITARYDVSRKSA